MHDVPLATMSISAIVHACRIERPSEIARVPMRAPRVIPNCGGMSVIAHACLTEDPRETRVNASDSRPLSSGETPRLAKPGFETVHTFVKASKLKPVQRKKRFHFPSPPTATIVLPVDENAGAHRHTVRSQSTKDTPDTSMHGCLVLGGNDRCVPCVIVRLTGA